MLKLFHFVALFSSSLESLKDRKVTRVARDLSSHNLPTDRPRKLIEPVTKQKVSQFLVKEIRALLGLNFFGMTSRGGPRGVIGT